MSEKKDLLGYCNEHGLPPRQFMQTFCYRCRNNECVNASWGGSIWQTRMSIQQDKLLNNPHFADPANPKYDHIRERDFPSLLEKAIQLEIADKRGDWEIPEVAVTDNKVIRAKGATTDSVDEAIKALARVQGKAEPSLPDRQQAEKAEFLEQTVEMMGEDLPTPPGFRPESEGDETDDPDVVKTPEETRPPSPVSSQRFSNTAVPDEGFVVGEGDTPKRKSESDPWAVPESPGAVVEVGAKVRMGMEGMKDGKEDK